MSQCATLFQEKATRDPSTGELQIVLSLLPVLPGVLRASVCGKTREAEKLWSSPSGYGNRVSKTVV